VARWPQALVLVGLLLVAACVPPPSGLGASSREETMQIEFERSGGVAGIRLATTVDTDRLPASDAARVRQLLDDAGFFSLPAHLAATTPGADRFQYHITVRTAERSHTVDIAEGAAPPALRPLLDWLVGAARAPR
jgi:emfourin